MLAFTFILGQKQTQLQSAMETVKICSKCVESTINTGSGFHCSSVLRLLIFYILYPSLDFMNFTEYVKVIRNTFENLGSMENLYFKLL